MFLFDCGNVERYSVIVVSILRAILVLQLE